MMNFNLDSFPVIKYPYSYIARYEYEYPIGTPANHCFEKDIHDFSPTSATQAQVDELNADVYKKCDYLYMLETANSEDDVDSILFAHMCDYAQRQEQAA